MNESILKAFATLGEKIISLEKEVENLKNHIGYLEYMEKYREKEETDHVPGAAATKSI